MGYVVGTALCSGQMHVYAGLVLRHWFISPLLFFFENPPTLFFQFLHCVMSFPLPPSHSLPFSLSFSVFCYLSIYLSISLSIFLFFLSFYWFIFPFIFLSLFFLFSLFLTFFYSVFIAVFLLIFVPYLPNSLVCFFHSFFFNFLFSSSIRFPHPSLAFFNLFLILSIFLPLSAVEV